MHARRPLLATVLLVTAVLAACGKGGDDAALSGEPLEEESSTTTAAEETTETTSAASDATEISLTGAEYVYAAGAPSAPVPAGPVTVSLENIGQEEHQASIVRFKEGKALPDLIAVGEDPSKLAEVIDGYGGPNAVAPGETVSSTQVLVPGEYLFICFIPTADGQPHATQGMIAPFTVEGEAPEVGDAAGQVVTLDEYTFGAPDGATFDTTNLSFENEGEQPHEAAIYALADGATFEDGVAFFEDPASAGGGAPPVISVGGIGPISPGIRSEVSLDLAPGDYLFVCFIPDVADGAPHLVKGMAELVTIE